MFGGGGRRPQRGSDLETRVTVSFADALRGVTSPIRLTGEQTCTQCRGSGAKQGTSPTACSACRGSGHVQRNVGGFAMSEPCRECRGTGRFIEHTCPDCRGIGAVHATRTVQVKIPAGVKDGSRIRLPGRGGAGVNNGPAGDLFVIVEVTPHPVFGRKDDHLTVAAKDEILHLSRGGFAWRYLFPGIAGMLVRLLLCGLQEVAQRVLGQRNVRLDAPLRAAGPTTAGAARRGRP